MTDEEIKQLIEFREKHEIYYDPASVGIDFAKDYVGRVDKTDNKFFAMLVNGDAINLHEADSTDFVTVLPFRFVLKKFAGVP